MAPYAKTAKVINVRPLTCWTPRENSCKYLKIAAKEMDDFNMPKKLENIKSLDPLLYSHLTHQKYIRIK